MERMTAHHSLLSRHDSAPRAWSLLGLRLVRRLREAQAAQTELHERVILRQEPWLEEFLHWSYDGAEWRLHGSYLPGPHGRASVTRSGWCPRAALPERSSSAAGDLDSPSACGG